MNIIRAIKFLLRQFLRKRSNFASPAFLEEPGRISYILGSMAGYLYASLQKARENMRIQRKRLKEKSSEYSIVFEIVKLSKELLFLLFLGLTLSIFLDWGFFWIATQTRFSLFVGAVAGYNFFTSPDEDFVLQSLGVVIGAVSAILGLIFGLYAVGLQLTTEKYSSAVSDFINEETVSRFLFKFLVFTDLFAILLLLRTKVLNLPLSLSYIGVIALVFVSLLLIVVFKDDYILKLKPLALYKRLRGEISDAVAVASQRSWAVTDSLSLVNAAQKRASKYVSLLETLFEDLCIAGNWNDAMYAPIVLAYTLSDYTEKKKYIDTQKGWWFPRVQKEVKASDSAALPIKLNFELQGRGPLRFGAPDYDWFEERIFKIFKVIEGKAEKGDEGRSLLGNLISAYEIILTGSYVTDSYGRAIKDTAGLFENQEIETYRKYLLNYFDLYQRLHTDDDLGRYLNCYFNVGIILIDGFNYGEFERILNDLVDTDGRLRYTHQQTMALNIPKLFHLYLQDYRERLNLERECEGRVITPINLFVKEVVETIKNQEEKIFDEFFEKLLRHQDTLLADLYSKGRLKDIAMIIKTRFEWFSRMLYLKKLDRLEVYSKFVESAANYIACIPKDILVELEFWEEIEKILFSAAAENRLGLFREMGRALIFLLTIIRVGESDIDNLVYRNRLIINIGGYVYLLSELRNDKRFLLFYSQIIEDSCRPGALIQMLELLAEPKKVGGLDLTLKLINWETTRYHHRFADVCSEIDDLPRVYSAVEFYSGMQEVADHPSEFIRTISYRCYNPEEKSVEAFVEWMKRRELVRQLLVTLEKRTSI